MHFFLALLFLLVPSDEKTNIRPVAVDTVRIELERFARERNLNASERDELYGLLRLEDFYGTDISGNPVNLTHPERTDYTGSNVALFGYYAEWCPNCRQNLPATIRMYEKYRERGFGVVLTFMYSNAGRVKAYVNENNIPFPVLIGSEDREINPEVRLETTHYVLRTVLNDYRRWGTPLYIMTVASQPDTWYVVTGEFIEAEMDAFLDDHLPAGE
jgi:thiol-disulfide isomerase/thioredoxin